MRFKWSVAFTCTCAIVLGAISGLMAGTLLSMLIFIVVPIQTNESIGISKLLFVASTLGGAVVGGIYCRSLIRRSPDEWITPTIHCKYCDYDLTRNRSGQCPECGKRISEAQQKLIEKDHYA
jgi:hypothetical protein